jgi:hypothetical protein
MMQSDEDESASSSESDIELKCFIVDAELIDSIELETQTNRN